MQRSSSANPCLAVSRGYNAMRVNAPNVQSFLSFITQLTIRSASRRKRLPSVCIPACIEDNRAQQNTLESPSSSSSRGSHVWSWRSLKFAQGKVSLYFFCTITISCSLSLSLSLSVCRLNSLVIRCGYLMVFRRNRQLCMGSSRILSDQLHIHDRNAAIYKPQRRKTCLVGHVFRALGFPTSREGWWWWWWCNPTTDWSNLPKWRRRALDRNWLGLHKASDNVQNRFVTILLRFLFLLRCLISGEGRSTGAPENEPQNWTPRISVTKTRWLNSTRIFHNQFSVSSIHLNDNDVSKDSISPLEARFCSSVFPDWLMLWKYH